MEKDNRKNLWQKVNILKAAFLVVSAVSIAAIGVFVVIMPAVGKWKNATTANCLTCHTSSGVTVSVWSDSAATSPMPGTVSVQTGQQLTFYVKVTNNITGAGIGASIEYPANATPLGSSTDQQNLSTWTTYTPPEIMLSNNAVFAWNSNNVNTTKSGLTGTDVQDSDNNGYEIFPAVLNVPTSAAPGDYTFNIYGAATGGKGAKLATPLTITVSDMGVPNPVTDLSVNYNNTNDTMTLNWTTPNPPDNSGSITKFNIYRSTSPITSVTGLTPINSITTGLTGSSANTYSDDASSFAVGTTIYYAVTSVDAVPLESPVSSGPKTSAAKTQPAYPVPTMSSPAEGATFTGTQTLTASVTDDIGVTSVQFERSKTIDFASSVTIGTASQVSGTAADGNWSFAWNTLSPVVTDGDYYVRVVASDGTYTKYSSPFKYTIDNNPPQTVSMTAPANNATVQNVTALTANAVDVGGIARIDFEVSSDQNFITFKSYTGAILMEGTKANGTWVLNWSSNTVINGPIWIRARAYDGYNRDLVSTSFTYNVSNTIESVPHGNYQNGSTANCGKCHTTHNGQDIDYIQGATEKTLCKTCHDGTSAQKVSNFDDTYTNQHLYTSPNRALCSGCHDPHKSRTDLPARLLKDVYYSNSQVVDPTQYQLCFNCHQASANVDLTKYVASNYDILQYYSRASNSGQGTPGVDSGHYIRSTTRTYLFADGSTVPLGYQLRCTDCHERHGAKNKKLLRDNLGTSPTGPSVVNLTDPGTDLTVADERKFCLGCHNGTTRLYKNNDLPIAWSEGLSSGHSNSTQKCTGCHGNNPMHGAHAPLKIETTDIESSGGKDCKGCHSTVSNLSGSSQYLPNSTIPNYHHYSDNTVDFANPYNQTNNCLECHVDHDKFRPTEANPSLKRGSNLRQNWGDDPKASGYQPADSDFMAANPNGGLCINCHFISVTKRYTGGGTVAGLSKASTPSAADAATNYNSSAHNYNVDSTFSSDYSIFKANCTKCHNDDPSLKEANWQSGPNKFGAHSIKNSSILTPFADAGLTSPLEENLCYKCHDITGDYYGAATSMTARAKGLKDIFAKVSRHPVDSTSAKHSTTESTVQGWNQGNNRHVECDDCHNSHQAKAGTTMDNKGSTWGPDNIPHTADDTLSGALFGIWGVEVNYNNGAPGQPTVPIYTYKPAVAKQYELCLKCHSDYSWNNGTISNPPTSKHPAAGQTVGPFNFPATQPEIGQQFNPNNYSTHALFQPGHNQPAANLNPNWSGGVSTGQKRNTYNDPFNANDDTTFTTNPNTGLDNTFVDGWGTQSLTVCTDCHSTDNASGDVNVPDGPHGSTVKWILRKADPRITVTLADGSVKTPNAGINSSNIADAVGLQAAQNNLCLNCHRADVYGWGTRSASSVITFANLSRFRHSTNAGCMGPDGDKGSTGVSVKNDDGSALPGCMNCHGGLEPGGMHGSSLGKGTGFAGATSELGKRFSNGASWSPGHALGDSSGQGACWNASVNGVNSCAKHTTSGGAGFTPNYYYPWE